MTHEVQALLEAAASMSDDPTLRDAFERQADRVGRELRRLRDADDVAATALQQQARALAAARESRDEKIRQASAEHRSKVEMRRQQESLRFPSCPETICPKSKGGP